MDHFRTIISATLSAISYQFFGPGIFFSLVPLFIGKWKKTTLLIWGLVYTGCLHLFLIQLYDDTLPIIAIGLWALTTIYFSLFYGVGGLATYAINKRLKVPTVYLLPLIWPFIEVLKNLGSFGNPNGNLGFALSNVASLIGSYSIVGHIGVGLIIISINSLIWCLFQKNHKKKIGLSIIIILFGMIFIKSPNTQYPSQLTPSIIQTSIPQYKKMDQNHWATLKNEYLDVIRSASGNLVVLPESIIPTDIKDSLFFNELQSISIEKKQSILVGSFIRENGFYNGSYFIQPSGDTISYKKQRLMPFGETLPFRSIIKQFIPDKFLFNDFYKGHKDIDINSHGSYIRPIICLEGIYGQFYQSETKSIITILANNAWFNQSSAGNKLVKFATVHAAEFQTPVLIAANYGESAIILANGKIIKHAKNHKKAILESDLLISQKQSFFARWPFFGISCLWLSWILLSFKLRK